MAPMKKRSVRNDEKCEADCVDVDYVAAGIISTVEGSKLINQRRRLGQKVASEIRELYPDSDFATLPAQLQPIMAVLLALGADPGNLVLNASSDATIHLFGTILSPDRDSWRIFQATGRVGDANDVAVRMRNLGTTALQQDGVPFDTMEDAVEVLQQIQELCIQDPDAIDRMETGGEWRH